MFTGYILALLAAILWGVSGTFAQYLFQNKGITSEWLVAVRMLMAAILLLIYPLIKDRKALLAPWQNKKDRLSLILFGIVGMLFVQFTFFVTIEYSNAATATILQYLGPAIIACYYSFIEKRIPLAKELAAIGLALLGTFLIVTHGSLESLSISFDALFWGIASAIAMAFYAILPIQLMKRYQASVVVGWALLVGGLALSFIYPPWNVPGLWDINTFKVLSGIIVFGTAVAFYSYSIAIKRIGPRTASLLGCVEPLSAAVMAVLWLKVDFGIYDWVGTFCILITIVLLAKNKKQASSDQS